MGSDILGLILHNIYIHLCCCTDVSSLTKTHIGLKHCLVL